MWKKRDHMENNALMFFFLGKDFFYKYIRKKKIGISSIFFM